jgi:hypothetical protein
MNWNDNTQEKRAFLDQMEDWYVSDSCGGTKTAQETQAAAGTSTDLAKSCCVTPVFKCHYKDKPSIRECKDSPAFTEGRVSFW